ncbi:MAG: hypothetical protein QOD45_906 [Pseudonocardiales bacterium]|nr:hypothetical protein [Pseudonocardiales bacterium]
MGFGVSIVFIAIGAVTDVANHPTLGVLLLVIGGLGLLLDLIIYAPRRRGSVVDSVYPDGPVLSSMSALWPTPAGERSPLCGLAAPYKP